MRPPPVAPAAPHGVRVPRPFVRAQRRRRLSRARMRRTCATDMAELGIPPHIIEVVLNHISGHKAGVAGISNRAEHSAERKVAVELLAAHVEADFSGKEPGGEPVIGTPLSLASARALAAEQHRQRKRGTCPKSGKRHKRVSMPPPIPLLRSPGVSRQRRVCGRACSSMWRAWRNTQMRRRSRPAKAACREWLEAAMREAPTRGPKPKREWRKKAKTKFSVSGRAFDQI